MWYDVCAAVVVVWLFVRDIFWIVWYCSREDPVAGAQFFLFSRTLHGDLENIKKSNFDGALQRCRWVAHLLAVPPSLEDERRIDIRSYGLVIGDDGGGVSVSAFF